MSGEEARAALISSEPVELNGIIYARMERIIYQRYKDGIGVTAELVDKTGRSSTIVPIRYINRIEEVTDNGSEENVC